MNYLKRKFDRLGIEQNDGTQDNEEVYAYDFDPKDPVCPCCGKRLKIRHKEIPNDEFIGENTMNEAWEAKYLTDRAKDVAYDIFNDELADVQPETDEYGNITNDYLRRFEYSSPSLKRAVKRASYKLSSELKQDGFDINPWYCEMEIFDALKCFSR